MDRDKKITLSLFLTWLVFGLFNLFGQPEAFVPPIFIDGLMIGGLGIFFCFPFQKNIFFPLLILFPALFILISGVENNWFEANRELWLTGFIISIFTILFFALGSIRLFSVNKKTAIFSTGTCILFSISLLNAFLEIPITIHPLLIYASGGSVALFSVILLKASSEVEHTFKKVSLLLTLSVAFDLGNYLALLSLGI